MNISTLLGEREKGKEVIISNLETMKCKKVKFGINEYSKDLYCTSIDFYNNSDMMASKILSKIAMDRPRYYKLFGRELESYILDLFSNNVYRFAFDIKAGEDKFTFICNLVYEE